jgi:hypothetical protein
MQGRALIYHIATLDLNKLLELLALNLLSPISKNGLDLGSVRSSLLDLASDVLDLLGLEASDEVVEVGEDALDDGGRGSGSGGNKVVERGDGGGDGLLELLEVLLGGLFGLFGGVSGGLVGGEVKEVEGGEETGREV